MRSGDGADERMTRSLNGSAWNHRQPWDGKKGGGATDAHVAERATVFVIPLVFWKRRLARVPRAGPDDNRHSSLGGNSMFEESASVLVPFATASHPLPLLCHDNDAPNAFFHGNFELVNLFKGSQVRSLPFPTLWSPMATQGKSCDRNS